MILFRTLHRSFITDFEYLCNEIIYEIFKFLDYFHAYDAFYNLNRRFRHLSIRSPLTLKLNVWDKDAHGGLKDIEFLSYEKRNLLRW